MNPYTIFIDNYSVAIGNPRLMPELSSNVDLGLTFRNSLSFTLSYKQESDIIQQVVLPNPKDSLVAIYQRLNLNSKQSFIATILLPVKINSWWETNNSLACWSTQYNIFNVYSSKPTIQIKTSQNITIPSIARLDITGNYISDYLYSNMLVKGYYRVDLGLQKNLLKNKLSARVVFNNIFNSEKKSFSTVGSNYNFLFNQLLQTRSVVVQFVYNFNFGSKFSMKQFESSNADEKNRL